MKETEKKKANEQEIQQMYMQLQYIEEQARQLEQEAQAVEQKHAEFLQLIEQIDVFKKSKKGAKVFSDVGAGIYAQAKLENASEFLVNVGAGKFVKKSFADVKTALNKQSEELKKVQSQITQNLQMLAIQSQIIQGQMQQ